MKKPIVFVPLALLAIAAVAAWYFTRRSYLIERAIANGKAKGDENVNAAMFETFDTSTLLGLAYNF